MLPGNPPQRQDACSQNGYSTDTNKATERATDRTKKRKKRKSEHNFIKLVNRDAVGVCEMAQTKASCTAVNPVHLSA